MSPTSDGPHAVRDTAVATGRLGRLPARVRRVGRLLANLRRTLRPPPRRPVELTHELTVGAGASDSVLAGQIAGRAGAADELELTGSPDSVTVTRPATGASVRVVSKGDQPTGDLIAPVDPRLGRPIRWTARGRGRVVLRPTLPTDGVALHRLVERCRWAERVVADAELTASPSSARVLATIASTGAPLELHGSVPATGLLGPRTAAIASTAGGPSVHDRELRSIRLRRAALHEHGPTGCVETIGERLDATLVGRRQISILLASNRPDDLPHALDRIARQRDCDVQVVVGLHGAQWPSSAPGDLTERFDGDLSISRHDESASLGQVLDALARRADGDLVAKWDDDDWYGPDHLADLVLAFDYANADVVGKFAEFVYLEASDTTIRRSRRGAETYDWNLAGGTMLMSATWLAEVGGWPDAPRWVDQLLLDATRRHGGCAYRTHGFQYVLRRRTAGHTWSAPDSYFLGVASERRPGLDLAFADIEDRS